MPSCHGQAGMQEALPKAKVDASDVSQVTKDLQVCP
jgi:hypothetical protein